MVVPCKTILVLIGPKGAGKSYLGRLIERELGVGFLDVEALFRAMPDAADVRAGYDAVVAEAERRLSVESSISLEVTGVSEFTESFLDELARNHRVKMIRIVAPLETCLQRVRSRDASLHLPASEGMIKKVHDMSTNLELDFDAAIENVDLSDAALVGRVREVLRNKEDVR